MFNYQQGGVATLDPQTVGLNGQTRIPEFGGIPTAQPFIGNVPVTGIPMSQPGFMPFNTATPQVPGYPAFQPGINTVSPFGFNGFPAAPVVNPGFNPMVTTPITAATPIPYGCGFAAPTPAFNTPAFNTMLPWANQFPVPSQFISNTVPYGGINGLTATPFAQVNPMTNPLAFNTAIPLNATCGVNVPGTTPFSPVGVTPGINALGAVPQVLNTPITPLGAVQSPLVNTPFGAVTNPWIHSALGSAIPNTVPFNQVQTLLNPTCNTPIGTGAWGQSLFGTPWGLNTPVGNCTTPFQTPYGWAGVPGLVNGNPFTNTPVVGPLGTVSPFNPQIGTQPFGPINNLQTNPWACNPFACNIPGYAGQTFGGVGGLIPSPFTIPAPTTFGTPMNSAAFCPVC